MCQPRCSTSIVRASIHLPLNGSRTCAACVIDGVYATQHAPGTQHRLQVRDHLPRLG